MRVKIKNSDSNYHVHLTTFLCGSDHAEYITKADLQKTKVNDTDARKVCVDSNKLCTGRLAICQGA